MVEHMELYGYQFSVYSWIARLALQEKGATYHWIEINPFAEHVPPGYLVLHPFKRVPVLVHGRFNLYETSAITRYVDEVLPGPQLQQTHPETRARCNQIMSMIDSYAYWPLVRQVFSHRIFRPCMRRESDLNEVAKGLDAAQSVLGALEVLAQGGEFLCGKELSLADSHLAPMIGYFSLAPEGAALVRQHEKLDRWWSAMARRDAFQVTKPRLPERAA